MPGTILSDMRLENVTVNTEDGPHSYALGRGGVIAIEHLPDGNIAIEMQPVERSRGDSDCKYMHRRVLMIPWLQILELEFISKAGLHACCRK